MRGDIYRLRAARDVRGNEQQGHRYGIIVQSDAVLRSTILIAPTSRSAKSSTIRPEITINGTTARVLVEQTSAVATDRLGDFAGRLDACELVAINEALRIVLALM